MLKINKFPGAINSVFTNSLLFKKQEQIIETFVNKNENVFDEKESKEIIKNMVYLILINFI